MDLVDVRRIFIHHFLPFLVRELLKVTDVLISSELELEWHILKVVRLLRNSELLILLPQLSLDLQDPSIRR